MMTQPIRKFKNLSSEAASAGGNANFVVSYEDRRLLELQARSARGQLTADSLVAALRAAGRHWRRLVDGIRADFRLHSAEAELRRMSDRELADIGLARSDIPFAVRQPPHGMMPSAGGFDGTLEPANENLRRTAGQFVA